MKTFTERQAKYAAIKLYLKEQHGIDSPQETSPWQNSDEDFFDECTFPLFGDVEVLVVTASERDERWDESLESYIDDCILPELPEMAQRYFDYKAWKRDARFDGAGHCLAHYDGIEHEYKFGDHWIYVYRQN